MTLTESDLSELLAALKAGEMTDTIRTSLEWILQQLIEAEVTVRRNHTTNIPLHQLGEWEGQVVPSPPATVSS